MDQDNKDQGGPDLNKILLPNKEARSNDSAQRVNAGELLAQEQKAAEPSPEKTEEAKREGVEKLKTELGVPKKETSYSIPSLETYKSDIETVIEQKNLSAVQIAAAEAQRTGNRGGEPEEKKQVDWKALFIKSVYIGSGVILIAAAVGVAAFIFLRPTTVPVEVSPASPFISVDATKVITFPEDQVNRNAILFNLEAAREQTQLPLGLINRIYLNVASTTNPDGTPINAQSLLSTIAPNIPASLLRTIEPEDYLVGVHVYDENQPFIILKVDSYEQAFSAMLDWESTMNQELAPFFTRKPSVHTSDINPSSTSTAPQQVLSSGFTDGIVDNHDARVIKNQNGDILLLWTFLDRSTLVITTNDHTLQEIITRLSTAPVNPGQ